MTHSKYSLVEIKICQSNFFPFSHMKTSLIDNDKTGDVTYLESNKAFVLYDIVTSS